MPTPSVTYTFAPGTTAASAQVNQNFTDLINILTDSSSDFMLNSLDLAGSLTVDGNTTLGSASGDSILFVGRIGSSAIPGTTNTYDLGTSSLTWGVVYSNSIQLAGLTASRAVVTDGSKNLATIATTSTELGYVNGVTSAIQTQIDTKTAGAASSTDNAVARFDLTTGKVIQNSGVTISDGDVVAGVKQLDIAGSSSGVISVIPQAAAGTFNFNLPTTAGTTGQYLTSQGGSSTAMTWTTPATFSYWSGFTAAAAKWSTASSTFVDGTNTGGNALTTRQSAGISVSAGGSNIAGITFTPASASAIYLVSASFNQFNTGANNNSFQLTDGTTVVATGSGFSTGPAQITMTSIFVPGTGSAVTIKIQMATSGGSLRLETEGVSALSTPCIEWSIVRLV